MNKDTIKTIWLDQLSHIFADKDPYIPRDLSLLPSLKTKEITIVTGVRRSGKSSLTRQMLAVLPNREHVLYLSFEDPRLIHFKETDFETLYDLWIESIPESETKIAIFDEIQNVEGWERWINYFSELKKVKVFITGSNSKLLSSELATHLTGRHEDFEIFPLSFREVAKDSLNEISTKVIARRGIATEEQIKLQKLFNEYFLIGGFPRAWVQRSSGILGEYYTDIINRDIVRRHKLRIPQYIMAFGSAVMSDLGRRINKTKLASDIGVAETITINKYLNYFEECYLGFELRKFDRSIRKQLKSIVKFYAIDHVLAQKVGIGDRSKSGFYLENLVFVELLRREHKVYYYQHADSFEVDFVAENNESGRTLIQVAWNINNKDTLSRELRGFSGFKEVFPKLEINKKIIITAESCKHITLPEDVVTKTFMLWALEH